MNSTFDGCFFLTICGVASGLIGILTLYCLRSKCKKCSICYGLIIIDRDTQGEVMEDIEMMNHNIEPFNNGQIPHQH
jgi:hypothetical protein